MDMIFTPLMLIIIIPLFVNIFAIIFYHRWFKFVATLILPITILTAIFDGYSATQNGNLTGLVTLYLSGPALIVLALMGLGNLIQRSRAVRISDLSRDLH